jgi:hypothetical protein
MVHHTTVSVADAFVKHGVCRYGVPDYFQSDRGTPFISELAQAVYKKLGIKRGHTTAYHPQANGATERFNRTLKNTLRIWCNEQQDDWDELLPFALFAYNTSYHSIMKETPFYLQFGREATLPLDVALNRNPDSYIDQDTFAQELSSKLYHAHERVREIWKQVNADREEAIAASTPEPEFQLHDKVWLHNPVTQKGLSKKLTRRWIGPFEIIAKQGRVNYLIDKKGKSVMVHANRLKAHRPVSIVTDSTDGEQLNRSLTLLEASNRAIMELIEKRNRLQAEVHELTEQMSTNTNNTPHTASN